MASNVDGAVVIEVDMNVNDAEKELKRLKDKIVKLESDLDMKKNEKSGLVARLEETKKEYAELQKELRGFKGLSASEFDASPEVQKIADKMQELEKYISKTESDLGKAESDIDRTNIKLVATKETYGKIALLAESLERAGSEAGESIKEKSLQNMSTEAVEANQRISELSDKIAELEDRQAGFGLALGKRARAEYNDLAEQINAAKQEMADCESYLDQLAENGQLQNMADGAEIAKDRIYGLTNYLEELEEKQARFGLALGAKQEYDELASECRPAH